MAFPSSFRDREQDKFVESSDGKTAVRVKVDSGSPIPVEVLENDFKKVLNAPDRERVFSWLDFGTKNERVSSITYSAPSVGGMSFVKTFIYSLVGNSYRLDNEEISQL
jgi:hypothetical protein